MLTKYAQIESILEVKQTPKRLAFSTNAGESLAKFAALKDEIQENDGYLYVRCRAISSRVNKNNDGWPSEELMHSHKTFIGRPVFVDHNNDDPKRTRGVIVDANCFVDEEEKTSKLDPYYSTAPANHKPPTWVELLIEVDAETYPRLAKEVRTGGIDAVSMGANIEKSVCSVCANEAATPNEYCDHIKKKGVTFEIVADNGEKVRKKAYEDCYGVNFFEISFVFDPADTTALISEKTGSVDQPNSSRQFPDGTTYWPDYPANGLTVADPNYWASHFVAKTAVTNPIDFFVEPVGAQHDQDNPNYIPQSDQITAPQEVNTLRPEHRCPICKAADMTTDPDGIERCSVCGHIQEPEPLNNPDLDVSRDTDLRQDATEMTDQQGNPEVPVTDGTERVEIAPTNPVAPVAARNQQTTSAGISDMEDLFTTQAIETTLGGEYGIHKGTIQQLRNLATVKITFPTVESEENFVVIPEDNPVFSYFLAQESAAKLGCSLGEVPIVVETVGEGDLHAAVEAIRVNAATHPREAAKKSPILNTKVKPSDEPKGEKIVSDELAPRETKTADSVAIKTVQIGDKTYKLEPIDEEDPEKTPEQIVDELEDDDEEKKDKDDKKDSAIEIESGRSILEIEKPVSSEEKETKLLTAMKIADDAIDLGVVDKRAKMVYISELEERSLDSLDAIQKTLALVKSAGLQKTKLDLSGVGLRRIPRLAHNKPDNHTLNGSFTAEPDADPDFLLGV